MRDHSVTLEQFSGPLALLLTLIEEQKMSVSEVSLSKVTEQYLVYVEQMEETNVDELADFLVIASKLLLMKSKQLLPQFFPEEVERPSLEEQLRVYQQFVKASGQVNDLWMAGRKSAFRVEPPRKPLAFVPPVETLTTGKLHHSMIQLIERLRPAKPLPRSTIDRTVSVKEKIDRIRLLLKKVKEIRFTDVIEQSENKSEVIVGFLALLELVKQQHILLKQKKVFDDIIIQRA